MGQVMIMGLATASSPLATASPIVIPAAVVSGVIGTVLWWRRRHGVSGPGGAGKGGKP